MLDNMAGAEKLIAVIGGSECSPSDYAAAETVGRLITENDGIVICGGMSGVMEAVCKGAFRAGGLTIGILPSADIEDANPYVKIPVATGMGIGRNIIVIRTAQAVIAVDGKYGTLSEIAYALQLGKPVFGLNSWSEIPGMIAVKSPEEAVKKALESIK